MKKTVLVIVLSGALLLQGCIYVDEDRGSDFERGRSQPTLGQELLDLDRARAEGAITASEYNRLKEKILAGDF